MSRKPLLHLACLLALTAPMAQAGADEHHHHGPAAVSAALHLNHGQKWETDGPLRDGMGRIRAAMAARLEAIHGGRLSRAGYGKLAAQLEKEVGGIVGACKLPEEADAMLHLLIAELGAGIDTMAGRNKGTDPRRGAVGVMGALENYGRYFDHPGWQPLAH